MTGHPPELTPLMALKAIWRRISPARRRQQWLSLGLMLLGGLAEMISIGAVVPFLAAIIDPERAASLPFLRSIPGIGGVGAENLVPLTVGLLIAAAVLAAIIRLSLTWFAQKFVLDVGHDISVEVYSRMLHQPYALYISRNTSELIGGLGKIQVVIFAVLLPAMQALVAVFVAACIIAMLIAIDPASALVAAGTMGLVYLGVSLAFRKTLKRVATTLATAQTERVKLMQEGLGGIRDILIDQSQAVFESQFRKLDRAFRRAETINVFVAAAPRFVIEGAGIVVIAVIALYASGRPGGIMAMLPIIGALALGAQRLLPLLQLIYSGWSQFRGASVLLVDVERLLTAPVSLDQRRQGSETLLPFESELRVEGVSFHYAKQDQPALSGIDLVIQKGQRIGLIGTTGSGKSTLIDVIMGLLEPSEGQISVDGAKLGESNRAFWQARIAHVPQTIFLSDSTITSNIAFGEDPGVIDRERVRAAARVAQIDDFIAGLPNGYETTTGERGIQLSGGQRQRIGIARAIYKEAEVLVLDEATSALDEATEADVMAALSAFGRKLTIIMIAHRLSTLSYCDDLVRLEGGRIVARGPSSTVIGAFRGEFPKEEAKVVR